MAGDARLSPRARREIETLPNERLFSIASAWEIAIKASLGKLTLSAPFADLVPGQLRANGIKLLPLEPGHLAGLISLPLHHRDPFDRVLVAQAMFEDAVLVSADPLLDQYGIRRIW